MIRQHQDYHPAVTPWLRAQLGALEAVTTLKTFALSITDRCNIKCDFCCHPFMDSEIAEDDAVRMVTEACAEGYHEICVTGGEPMLRRGLVYRLARIARDGNKMFGMISNGFWAKSAAAAAREVAALVEAGVCRLTISWDPSHGAYVPAAKAMHAIMAAMDAGMKVTLVGSFKEADDDHRRHGFDLDRFDQWRNCRVVRHAVSPAGKGEGLALDVWDRTDVSGIADDSRIVVCPSNSIQELVVFSRNGLAQPCCSIYAGYKAPHLRVGDWRRQSVGELTAAHENDGYFRIIRSSGFGRVYEIVREARPDLYAVLPPPAGATDACSLCAALMRSRAGPAVRALCDEAVGQRVDETLGVLETLFA